MARTALTLALGACLCGCAAGPAPEPAAPPPQGTGSTGEPAPGGQVSLGLGRIISGSADSVGALPGTSGALYYYRFRQTSPASDRFTFKDRELSFYFRPTPDALHFQVENLTTRPVWLDWDRCTYYGPLGSSGKVAHSTTRYRDRYSVQTSTQILGLQRFGDYVLPMDDLIDPGADTRQLFRALLPEDESAPQYSGRDFGVDLAFRVEDQPRTYSFRFKIASVIPSR